MEPFQENLLSLSFRQREPWVSIAEKLLHSTNTQWTEADLEDHDIASTRTLPQLGITQSYRFILLSQLDTGNPTTANRIEQLYLHGRGRNAAIIFLVDEDESEGAMQAFMKLQTEMIEGTLPSLPIISITHPDSLPTALNTFLTSAETSQTTPSWPLEVTRDLLPHCTVNNTLSPETITALTASTPSLKSLLEDLSTPEGQVTLTNTIPRNDATALLSFWTHEFVLA
ncbi:hypothetical protein B0T16DRAFT_401425 [Cercophora newfieldiana]|uniref:Uncharacterized protein n=1 Tax=Cercophora newfieldiana TaxID=92897 RepID=A0AA39YRH9_9PEZI|nr:hypothetical protein B0T16DRAFT_401425 [Cercophora newfieldiana]